MTRTKLTILAAAALFLTTACFSQPYPNKSYFNLKAEHSGGAAGGAGRRTLVLGAVNAAAGFEDRSLVYRVGLNQFESDFYNELVAAPARLLADLAAQFLDDANPKLRTAKNPGMSLADFGLEVYLESFYGDFTQKPPAAVVDIRFTLNDLRGARARVIMDKNYHRARPISEKNAAALVAGLNECANEILAELNRDIENAVSFK